MPLLRLMDTPQEALSDGYAYISVIAGFMLVTFVYNLCAGLLRSVGDSFMPLVFLVISSVVNIVLDILFVARLGMGIQGAAMQPCWRRACLRLCASGIS